MPTLFAERRFFYRGGYGREVLEAVGSFAGTFPSRMQG